MVSGSWPGEIYLFRGLEKGFAAPVELQRTNGEAVNVGKAAAVALADWDGDGDLDLVVGTIDGAVQWLPNESTPKGLAFGAPHALLADGEPIAANDGDAGPCVADWDGDGRKDLLLGAGDGGVTLFRNTAKNGLPAFGPGETLVEPGTDQGPAEDDGTLPRGSRSKVAVADWNGDGKPDLLVGDFVMIEPEEEEPVARTPEEEAKRAEMQKEVERLQERLLDRYAAHRLLALKRLGLKEPLADEDEQRVQAAAEKAQAADSSLQDLQERVSDLWSQLEGASAGVPSGHVWLYLRAP